ncbi:MAG: hypothetical protein BWY78_00469 [Alphaproteobacteria bacterium ADurb.Bin438]|nr:MAG: hypothetical protein BWY78_00469 [Alphaproteobacteria bacterium ADurb.Bin438]
MKDLRNFKVIKNENNIYKVNHAIACDFDDMSNQGFYKLKLIPKNLPYQMVKNLLLNISPNYFFLNDKEDFFGNKEISFSIENEHKFMGLNISSEVILMKREYEDALKSKITIDEINKIMKNPKEIEDFWASTFLFETPNIKFSKQAASLGLESFDKDISIFQNVLNIAKNNDKGLNFFVSALRILGIPCKISKGYGINNEKIIAIASFYIPKASWVDIDVDKKEIINDNFITLSWGYDANDLDSFKADISNINGKCKISQEISIKKDL